MPVQATVQDPVKFLELYQKIEKMNPLACERICGIIDGMSIAVEVAEKTKGGSQIKKRGDTNENHTQRQ